MAVCSGDPDAAVAIGKDAGFMISTDDLTKAQSKVSDEEPEGAAGGGLWFICIANPIASAVVTIAAC